MDLWVPGSLTSSSRWNVEAELCDSTVTFPVESRVAAS
jgi:hypothetical protein